MPMEEALVARLVAAATPAGERISWFGRQRGDALPAGVLFKVSPGEDWTHEGPDGLLHPRVQIDSYAATETDAAALSRAIHAEMQLQRTVGGVTFYPAQLAGEQWIDEGEQDGGDPLFRVSQDFQFYHEETSA